MKKSIPKGFVFILCYVAYVAIYAARLNLSIASPEMIAGGFLSSEQYGFLGSAFFLYFLLEMRRQLWYSRQAKKETR